VQKKNATVAVIGAGDFIGGEIAKKFASEGFAVFAGRRNGAKLEPLVKEIEASGGEIHARSLDARKEEEITAFLNAADKHAPLEVCIFNIGANVNSRSWRPPSACSEKSGRWPAIPASSPAARRRG
jgi:short-subunit dehydrogenase